MKEYSAYIGITDVTDVHDITFVGKDGSDVLNLAWLELSETQICQGQ